MAPWEHPYCRDERKSPGNATGLKREAVEEASAYEFGKRTSRAAERETEERREGSLPPAADDEVIRAAYYVSSLSLAVFHSSGFLSTQ